MAAWALKMEGHQVTIYSRAVKSPIGGAQYLHNRIPGITPDEPDLEIDFIKRGLANVYARKAHGSFKSKSSWDTMPTGLVDGWSLSAAYDRLWQELHESIEDITLSGDVAMQMTFDYDIVVNTVPLRALCYQKHHLFIQSLHYIVPVHDLVIPKNTIIYNGYPVEDGPDGDPVNWWHRGSNLDGRSWLETAREGHVGGIPLTKPQSNNCNCFNERFFKVGRFGRWNAGVLADSAFWDVYNLISGVDE
jgi:hypothetical protein